MTRSLIKIALCSAVIFATPNLASASALNNQEIKALVNGNKIYLKIPFGGEFPLRYQKNGVVRGDGSGVGLGKYLAPTDEGRWWVKDNKLCQKWTEWYKGKTACFVISDVKGKKFRWLRSDGKKGGGRVE